MTPTGLEPRHLALSILDDVLGRKRPLDEALDRNDEIKTLADRDRAFLRNLVATTLRRLGQIDDLIDLCLDRPLPKKARLVRQVLRLGVCQLFFLETRAHAAVDTSVHLARRAGLTAHVKLVNAVLRRLSREAAARLEIQDAPRLNTPEWLWESWSKAYGEATCRRIAESHLNEPPVDISVNGAPESWAERLQAEALPWGTIRRRSGGIISDLPGFAEGEWWVQDAAARLAVELLGEVSGKRVIDLCAAPGGKTAALLAKGAVVTALDRSENRMKRLRGNMARLGFECEVVVSDAVSWRPAELADVVFLDAPCSATGTIRRHPDVARLKTPQDVERLTGLQLRLLSAAGEMVRPGGLVLYCTCSLQAEEGPEIVNALNGTEAPLEKTGFPASFDVPGQLEAGRFRSLPSDMADRGGMDGFFAQLFRRTEN